MANVIINDTNLTNIANAIREKNGSTDKYMPSEMADAIAAIQTGGGSSGDDQLLALVNGRLTEFSDDTITILRTYAFAYNAAMVTLDLPNCTRLQQYSLIGLSSLQNVNLPMVQYVYMYAFMNSGGDGCHLELPEAILVDERAFQGAYMNTLELPKVTAINTRCFYLYVGDIVDLGESCTSIGAYAFADAYIKTGLILRKSDAIVTLLNTYSLQNSSIANGKSYVYVPSALVDAYKADSYWSTYAAQIRAIEDYPDICG